MAARYRPKRKVKKDTRTEEERIAEEVSRTRMPRGKEMIGYIEQLLGAKRMYVDCTDGKRRLCRVPGRARRRVWVREGYYVLVEPWEIGGDERADVIWAYRKHQVEFLRKRGALEGI